MFNQSSTLSNSGGYHEQYTKRIARSIDGSDEAVSFEKYLLKIHEWNQNTENKRHDFPQSADGFDWTYREFS